MIETDEMEKRILSELQEAGEENIAAMINTVIDPAGNQAEIGLFQQALENLVRGDFVRMALSPDPAAKLQPLPDEQSLAMVAEIDSFLRFRTSDSRWTWKVGTKPHIVVTAAGRARADQILEQHGYQWWRARK